MAPFTRLPLLPKRFSGHMVGGNLRGFGGQIGDGTTAIGCTKCGGRFYKEEIERRDWNYC